jgi:transposase InsO family protein
LTPPEKERIYRDKLRGRTLPEIAADLGCSVQTVRKWWRYARDHGRMGLQTSRGRSATGLFSRFAPQVTMCALALKREHRRWGAKRVLVELRRDPALRPFRLPSASRLAVLFRTECPECVGVRRTKRPTLTPPPRPSAVHECWQLDTQEAIHLADSTVASVCSIRDVVGAAILASRAFNVSSPGRYRKLTWQEVRSVIRSAGSEWETLPDVLQTDNEVCLAGQPTDPMPSQLTLWLAGLGVIHRFIRPGQPTDQAQIERTHRTLDNFADIPDGLSDLACLQQRLDAEREQYNTLFPAVASDCAGHPPLLAHPELLLSRRPYRVEWERMLFDEQRVYQYLATVVLSRKVSKVGQIQLGGCSRGVGRAYAGQTLVVRCDAHTHEWVVRTAEGNEVARLAVQGVDVSSLTGLPDEPSLESHPIQLTLPWLVAK